MKKIEMSDLLSLEEYLRVRDDFRRRIIALKKVRRVGVGDKVSLVFENRDTVIFQVQEMMRAEHMTDDEKIAHEVETYNTLIPDPHELSATMFIEIEDKSQVRPILSRLLGIDEHLFLRIADRWTLRALFEPGRSREDKISSVQYIRFHLSAEQIEDFCNPSNELVLRSDHPNYRVQTQLLGETRTALIEDLVL